jgi:hypothetical protein
MRYKSLGIGLAAVLLILLGMPLWQGWRAHPLASALDADVCALLQAGATRELLEAPARIEAGMPGMASSPQSDPACHIELAGDDANASRSVTAVLITEAGMARRGDRQRSERFVETWLAEAKAGGSSIREASGPWRHGAWIDGPARTPALAQLLLDDAGVIWWFQAEGVEQARMAAFAATAARAARQVSR